MNSALTSKFKGSRVIISKAVSANYAFDDIVEAVNVDATSAPVTITLPAIASAPGRLYTVRKVDSSVNAVTIVPTGGDQIEGVSSITIGTQWAVVSIDNDGTMWHRSSAANGGQSVLAPGTTAGEILFANASLVAAGDTQFTWDAVNHRLAIGTGFTVTQPIELASAEAQVTVGVRNTNVAGYGGIRFFDSNNIEQLNIGVGNTGGIATFLGPYISIHSGTLKFNNGSNVTVASLQQDGTFTAKSLVLTTGGSITFPDGSIQTTAGGGGGGSSGLIPTGGLDDTLIQNAINAKRDVLLSEGTFYISKPLLITTTGQHITGAGSWATFIGTNPALQNFSGPMFVLTPNAPGDGMNLGGLGLLLRPARLGTGSGQYINLQDTAGASFNTTPGGGDGSFTVECFAIIDSDDASGLGGNSWIIGSAGASPSTNYICWRINQFRDISGRYWSFDIQLSGNNFFSTHVPVTALATKTHLAISFDQSTGTARCFVAGAATVMGIAVGQKPVQSAWEGVYVGDGTPTFPVNGPIEQASVKGEIGGIRFSRGVRYSSSFTPPTSNPTLDSNTMLLLNFDASHGPCLKGSGNTGSGVGQQDLYWVPRGGNGGPENVHIDSMSLNTSNGTGIMWSGISGGMHDIYQNGGLRGVDYYRDSFCHSSNELTFLIYEGDNPNGVACKSGITHTGSSTGLAIFQGVNITGGCFPLLDYGPGSLYQNIIITPNDIVVYPVSVFHGNDFESLSMEGFGFDIENPTSALQGGILAYKVRNVILKNGALDSLAIVSPTTLPVLTVYSSSDIADVVTLQNCFLECFNGSTLIQQNGPGTPSIIMENCRRFAGRTYTLSNITSNIMLLGGNV